MYFIIGSTPTHTPSLSSTDRERDRGSSGKKRRSPAKFQPPDQPPARKDWVPDTQQHVCMVCKRERFTMVSWQRLTDRKRVLMPNQLTMVICLLLTNV